MHVFKFVRVLPHTCLWKRTMKFAQIIIAAFIASCFAPTFVTESLAVQITDEDDEDKTPDIAPAPDSGETIEV